MLNFRLYAQVLFLGCSAVLAQVWPSQSYRSETFSAPDLSIAESATPAPGYLFFGPVGNGTTSQAPLIMTDSNDLIWHGPSGVPQNVRIQTVDGEPHLTYWSGYGAVVTTFGHGYGHVAILDNTYAVKYNICMTELDLVTPAPTVYPGNETRPCYLDNHESLITERNTLLATAYNVTQVDLTSVGGPAQGWVFDALFYEIDIATKKVLFRWRALDHIPLSQSNYVNSTGDVSNRLNIGGIVYGLSQAEPWDFFHINSVQSVSDGYIISSRYTWSVYKVNNQTGAIDWRLEGSNGGDFTLGPGIFFSWQHMARMEHQTPSHYRISLFDNDNLRGLANGTNATSGLLLDVDRSTKHVTLVHKLLDPAEQVYAVAQGSYQPLPHDQVVIGYGTYPIIKIFNKVGAVIYRAQFGNYFGSTTVVGYRAYKQEWHAQPHYQPKVFGISAAPDSTSVYMSWNGATDYDGWTVYAGNRRSNMHAIANLTRAGFETEHTLDATYNFVAAEATQNGEALRLSKKFKVQMA